MGLRAAALMLLVLIGAGMAGCAKHESRIYLDGVDVYAKYGPPYNATRIARAAEVVGWQSSISPGADGAPRVDLTAPGKPTLHVLAVNGSSAEADGFLIGTRFPVAERERVDTFEEGDARAEDVGPQHRAELVALVAPIEREASLARVGFVYQCACLIEVE